MYGIDISNWQAGINLAAVPADFVIIKATGGAGFVNMAFRAQLAAARADGQRVGLYHFVRDGWTNTTAEQEAAHFLQTIEGHHAGAILVLDWEDVPNKPSIVANLAWAKRWLDIVSAATGKKPLLYMNLSVANSYDWSAIAPAHPLWLAWYWDNNPMHGYVNRAAPAVKHWGTPAIWQYTQYGRLPGYSGDLDLNIAYTNPWETRQLLIPGVEGLYLP